MTFFPLSTKWMFTYVQLKIYFKVCLYASNKHLVYINKNTGKLLLSAVEPENNWKGPLKFYSTAKPTSTDRYLDYLRNNPTSHMDNTKFFAEVEVFPT